MDFTDCSGKEWKPTDVLRLLETELNDKEESFFTALN